MKSITISAELNDYDLNVQTHIDGVSTLEACAMFVSIATDFFEAIEAPPRLRDTVLSIIETKVAKPDTLIKVEY